MAEAPIKGLTIRFGADTTQFTTRLNALNRIIGNVQTQIRAMDKALMGDSASLQGLTAKFSLLREQAANTNVRLQTMNAALREADKRGLGKLAAEIGNTALYVQRMDANVKRVNKELNDTYEELRAVGSEAGVAFGKKSKADMDGWIEKLKESGNVYPELIQKAEQLVQKAKDLKVTHAQVTSEFEKAKNIRGYDVLRTDIERAEVEAKNLARQIVATKEAIDAASAESQKIERLGNEFKELKTEANMAEGELRQMNETLRRTDYKNQDALNRAVELTAERVRNAREQVENLNKQLELRKAQTGIEHVKESMVELSAKVDAARQKAIAQEEALAKQRATIDQLKQSYSSYTSKMEKGEHLTTEQAEAMGRLWAQIKKAEEEEQKLVAKAEMANNELSMAKGLQAQKKLQTEFNEAGAKLTSLTAKAKSFGAALMNSVRDFATGLGATMAPAVMMLGMHIINAGDTIDSAFRDMRKTVEGTEKDFQQLKEAAIDFSKTHPVSADTILEIEALGGQLGITVDKLEDFARNVSNLDIATNMTSEDIALSVGKLSNIFSESGKFVKEATFEYEKFADALVRLGNSEPALESDIMNITTRFAGMAAIVGVIPDEVLAIATAATATGQRADAAGGSLQRTFGRIEGAVAGVSDAMRNLDDLTDEEIASFEDAKESLADYADIAGMSAEEFATLWTTHEKVDKSITGLSTDVTGTTAAFVKFVEGLKRIKDEGGSVDATLQKLGITGVRDRQLLEGLTNTTKVLSDSLLMSSDAWNGVADQWGAAGDAAREAEKKAQGFSGKLQMLKNIAQDAGSAFADKLVPLLDALLEIFTAAASAVENMSAETASFITVVGGLSVALAPTLRMFAQTKITMGEFKKALGAAGVEMKGMKAAGVQATSGIKNFISAAKNGAEGATNLSGKIGNLVNSLGAGKVAAAALAAAGIAVAAAAIATLIKKMDDLHKATDGFKDSLYATNTALYDHSTNVGAGSSYYVSASKAVNDLIEKQARLHDELKKSTEETAVSIGMLEHWRDVILENNGASADNHAAIGRLEDAVKRLNDEYSLGLQVITENGEAYIANANGARLEEDAINDLIATKEREARATAIANAMAKVQEQRIEAVQALTQAQKELAIAQENYNDAVKRGDPKLEEYAKDLEDAQSNAERAQKAVDALDESQEALNAQYDRASNAMDWQGQRIQSLADQYPVLASELDGISATAFPEFVKAVEDSGHSVEEIQMLTQSEVEAMVNSWHAGTNDWVDDLTIASDRMKSKARETDTAMQREFSDMRSKTVSEISEMTGISTEKLTDMANSAGITSELAMKNWLRNIKDAKIPSGMAASEIEQAVSRELDKAQEAAGIAGDNVGAGFVRRLRTWLTPAYNAAYSMGIAAVGGLNDGAGNASPSKKTRQSGVWFGQGFELGMEKEEDAIVRQASLLGSLAAGALSAQSSATAGSLSGRAFGSLVGRSATTNNNDNSTDNYYITLNVEAHDLADMRTIDDFVAMARRAKANYATA